MYEYQYIQIDFKRLSGNPIEDSGKSSINRRQKVDGSFSLSLRIS
ncbi:MULTISPECIES: hypothetical protein [Exiguobacterium]|nr:MULTISPECIES: hypothetical protein [Exiguobacterium]MCT4793830.1 hypothetical protein [Exiguobacterium artemiae]